MIWQDNGFLLSNNKYNENSSIAEFFTENHGKVVGIIFGASSKKIKNYLLIGNKFHLNSNIRDDGKISSFKVEIDKIFTPLFFENKKKLACIVYAMNILKLLTVENQKNLEIFLLITKLFDFLKNDMWLKNFILWELELFKNIGFDIDFKNYVKNIKVDGDNKYVVESNSKIIPNFLINRDLTPKNKDEILTGFSVLSDFLEKTIIRPNNLNYPQTRIEFINLIK